MRKRIVAVFASGLMLGTVPSAARQTGAFMTGNTLLSHCDEPDAIGTTYCVAYVVGIADMMNDGISIGGRRACLPGGVTSFQVRDIAVAYLRRNPQSRHYIAASIVAVALADAFPCR